MDNPSIKQLSYNLSRHNILLYPGDFDLLGKLHPAESPTSIVRRLVRQHITRMMQQPKELDALKEFV